MGSKLLFLLLCFPAVMCAQRKPMSISGELKDSSNVNKIPNAMIMAVRVKDSVLIAYTRSDAAGKFSLKGFDIDTLQLFVSKKGYEDRLFLFLGTNENPEFEGVILQLYERARELEEVVVFANKEPMYFKGDTLVYIADSFKTKKGDVVEDLLRKLPGVQVQKDGKFKVNGKEITKVLVDGDEFFGSDQKMATQNIEAAAIDKLNVYTEGGTDSDGEQVLDLKLKDDAKKGYFGKLDLSSNFNQYHQGTALFNRFTPKQKFGVFAIGSTVPNSGLSYSDLNSLGFDNNWSFDEDNNSWNPSNNIFQESTAEGIPKAFKTGMIFNRTFSPKVKLSSSIGYTKSNVFTLQGENTQFLLGDTSYTVAKNTRTSNSKDAFSADINFDFKLDSLTKLEIKANGNIGQTTLLVIDTVRYLSAERIAQRNGFIDQTQKGENGGINNSAKLIRNFMKKKRLLEIEYNAAYVNGLNNLSTGNTNQFVALNSTLTLNQLSNTKQKSMKQSGSIKFEEPLGKKWLVGASNRFVYEDAKNGLLFSADTFGIIKLDSNSSTDFTTKRLSNVAKVFSKYEWKKNRIMLTMGYKTLDRKSFNQFTSLNNNINNAGFIPSFGYKRKINSSTEFRFNYSLDRSFPTFDQTQRGKDISDPNNISFSNINLNPSVEHRINTSFNSYQITTDRFIFGNIWAGVTNNDIVSSVSYDQFGRSFSTYVNVNDIRYAGFWSSGSYKIWKKKLQVNHQAQFNYNGSKSFANNELNKITNSNFSTDNGISYDKDSLTISIDYNINFSNTRSTLNQLSNQSSITQAIGVSFRQILPLHFEVSTDARYNIVTGRAAGYNPKFLIWNAEIRNTFKKDGNFEAYVRMNDILAQNTSNNRFQSGNIITDRTVGIVTRYLQVGFTWKFKNKLKVKTEDTKAEIKSETIKTETIKTETDETK